jgi:hypothetical protein
MRGRSSAWLLFAAMTAIASCVSAPRCPTDRVCGNATWYTPVNGQTLEGRVVVAPLNSVAGGATDGSEALTLGSRPVFLRFDLRNLGEGTIESAVVSLAPHPSWHPSGITRVIARGVTSGWSEATVRNSMPVMQPDVAGEVVLPGRTRIPVLQCVSM